MFTLIERFEKLSIHRFILLFSKLKKITPLNSINPYFPFNITNPGPNLAQNKKPPMKQIISG